MNEANKALCLLAENYVGRQNELGHFNKHLDEYSPDDQVDSSCLMMDTFYEEGGPEDIKSMKEFDIYRFELIWNHLGEFIIQR